jgi:hypothetical protein
MINIPVKIDQDFTTEGFQIALDFASEELEVMDVIAGSIKLTADDYHIEDNQLFIAWTKLGGEELKAGDVLFSIQAYAQNGILSEEITLGDRFDAEMYNVYEEVYPIEWSAENESVVSTQEVEVTKIFAAPNPFNGSTKLEVYINETSNYNFSIFTVNGNEVLNKNISLSEGNQSIIIDESMIQTSGIYYVYIKGNNKISVAKIIKM